MNNTLNSPNLSRISNETPRIRTAANDNNNNNNNNNNTTRRRKSKTQHIFFLHKKRIRDTFVSLTLALFVRLL